ncbi:Transcriptional regulator form adherence 6 [Spathaspora sp. JA1]|nr:Transcriptional regulator form adherence 6 [Spathaspora sp. JA1]
MVFPNPPVMKTTIIQLNKQLDSDDKNYEILTNEYTNTTGTSPANSVEIINSASTGSSNSLNKKKRRRSSANIDSEELAKRKHETKQLHSIIEKRRRIKINREFEALKYLIPACRASNSTQQPTATGTGAAANKKNQASQSNANGNKIDGMYKLTILKSSVEYILYLHHIIQKQHELLQHTNNEAYEKFNIDFTTIPLDVNQYRNIDKEFNFKDLIEAGTTPSTSPPPSSEMSSSGRSFDYRTHSIEEEHEDDEGASSSGSTGTTSTVASNYQSAIPISASSSISELKKPQLPSPEFTPDIAPILTMLNRYQTTSTSQSPNLVSRKSSYSSPNMLGIKSNNPSPFTIPMKSSLSGSTYTSPSMVGSSSTSKSNGFRLPEPAVDVDQQLVPPRKKYFKSKNSNFVKEGSFEDKDQDASKTLLALRKSSIDSLLN